MLPLLGQRCKGVGAVRRYGHLVMSLFFALAAVMSVVGGSIVDVMGCDFVGGIYHLLGAVA